MSDEKEKNEIEELNIEEKTEEKDINELLEEVEIRSEEVQEIMGFIPHWIIRWGITVIMLVVIFILVGSYFFRYPDIIPSSIVLTTENPPANLVARTSGKIAEFYVQNQQKVLEGDFIAIIENATNHNHLLQLKEKLDALSPFFDRFAVDKPLPLDVQFDKNYSLGQLQATYAVFLSSYSDYQYFIELDFHRKKIDALKVQIERYKAQHERYERQAKIMEEELKISQENYERSTKLFKDEIISRSQFDNARSTFLQQQYSFEGTKSNLANSKIQISQLEQSLMELEVSFRDENKRLLLSLKQAYDNLTGQIAQWEQSYLLKAPINGVVSFNRFWSANQNVTAGDKVATIVPEKGGEIIGRLVLPIQGSGKVKVGQRVNIKFTNYPHMDYGIVNGIITNKSLLPTDNFYALEVSLPHGLRTSYGKNLDFSQEMQGSAEIVTEDIRLLERIFKPLKNILSKMDEMEEEETGTDSVETEKK